MRYDKWVVGDDGSETSLMDALLKVRGLEDAESAERFLTSPLSELHDPFLLPDMHKAVERINRAVADGEIIAVYGDYDVDGTTACALLTEYLRGRSANCSYFIPKRTQQGYGLHQDALKSLSADGVTLLITVDVGVTAFTETLLAKELGMDVIITDHHNCRDTLPDAYAVVNPKRHDSGYPFDGLAGVGVAFKLVCALEGPERTAEMIKRFGGLTALGTVADVMPMCGENRVLVRHGLPELASGSRPGLRHLMRCVGVHDKQPVTSGTISFGMAPALNAAGRMADASLAVELMLTDDELVAEQAAGRLYSLNLERRRLETEIYEQINAEWETTPGGHEQPAIVMACEDWHPGVTGIVCTRLLEKHRKPVFLISAEKDSGVGKGSARSPEGVCLPELLAACSHTLLSFGGHAAAAGFSIETHRIDEFRRTLFDAMAASQPFEAAPSELFIDARVNAGELTMENARAIQRFGPFGPGNPEPVLLLEKAEVLQILPLKDGKHVKLTIESGGSKFPVICFGFPARQFPLGEGEQADIAFALSLNCFRGELSIQLELKDIRLIPELAERYESERALYRRFLDGDRLESSEAELMIPTREDLVVIWQNLNRLADTLCQVRVPAHALVRYTDSPRVGMARLLAALDVFSELTLLNYEHINDMLCINLCGDNRKVNLLHSALLKRMTECLGGA